MRNTFIGLLFLFFTAPGYAACPSYPYTLSNGATADASQVMANFNSIMSCANNNLAPLSGIANFSKLAVGSYAGSSAPSNGLIVSGNVGIGNASPSYLLHVGSSSVSGAVAGFQNSSGTCYFTPAASGSGAFMCSSDERLKKDIVDSGDALTWLNDMRIRDFTIKATGERMTGVIAQEMQNTHAEMVHMGKDGFYGVDAPNVWKLVKAIQELKAGNELLKTENELLSARVTALESSRHAEHATSIDGRRRAAHVNSHAEREYHLASGRSLGAEQH